MALFFDLEIRITVGEDWESETIRCTTLKRSAKWPQTYSPEFSSAWHTPSMASWSPSAAMYAQVSVSSRVVLLSLITCLFPWDLGSSAILLSSGISSLFWLFSGKSFFSSGVNLNKSNALLISFNASDKNQIDKQESQICCNQNKIWVRVKQTVFSYFSLVCVLFGKEWSDSLSNMKLSHLAFLLAAWYLGRYAKCMAAHWRSESLPVLAKAFWRQWTLG